VVQAIRSATGGWGADVVFVAAPVPAVLQQGLDACRAIGTVVVVAAFFAGAAIPARQMQAREQCILGTHMYTGEDYALAIRLWEAGRVDFRPLLTERVRLPEAPEAIAALARLAKPDSIKTTIFF